MLSGGADLDMGTIGSLARTMAPAGGVAPIAGQIEYRWPISPDEERDTAPDDEDLLAVLGTGDLRDQARNLAMTTPAAELRDAYQVAAAMTAWADDACSAVEREIADGKLGDAVTEWVTIFRPGPPHYGRGAAGPGRGSCQHSRYRPVSDPDPRHAQGRAPAHARRELRRAEEPDGRAVLPGRLPRPLGHGSADGTDRRITQARKRLLLPCVHASCGSPTRRGPAP